MNKLVIGVVVIILIAVGGYFVLTDNYTTPTQKETGAVVETPEGWETYRSEEFGFEISHPEGYTIRQGHEPFFDEGRGYKRSELILYDTSPPIPRGDASRWGINVYENYKDSAKTIDSVISDIGWQYATTDRKEDRMQTTVSSISAIFVVVTTSVREGWISENVIFENNNRIYKIGNGAIEDPEFEAFYSSFRLL